MENSLFHVITTLDKGIQYLLNCQKPDGHWSGEVEGDTILESEYLLLMAILRNFDEVKFQKAKQYLKNKALPDGGWSIYPGGPPELNASVKAYFALKIFGCDPNCSFMVKTRKIIQSLGGADKCNSYTRFYLAALGQIPWDAVPAVPPELILLPRWCHFDIYEMSSWTRTFVIPLSIIWSFKPITKIDNNLGISELFNKSPYIKPQCNLFRWKRFFFFLDSLLKRLESYNIHPFRKIAIRHAETWMLKHFEKSAGLGAIFPPMVYSLIALRCLGYDDNHPQVKKAWAELNSLAIEDSETMRLQPCTSPVWDTAIAMNALASSSLSINKINESLKKSVSWLLEKEVRSKGDWSIKRPNLAPGGWYFEYENEFYPDIDDTAMVLLAFSKLNLETNESYESTIRRGIDWILGMQGKDGGWGAFDVDNNKTILCHVPFADHNAMIDPSTSDITARVIEMLSRYGYTLQDKPIQKAVSFILREQESDGSWYGRWGCNYIYGTWQALKGLTSIGIDENNISIQRGAKWLISRQNSDGGWGESYESYRTKEKAGYGPSTPSQTAWAIMGLISAGCGKSDYVKRGIRYLIETQNDDGSWNEEMWTATGFPLVFYLRYDLYRISFPIWALGMYVEFMDRYEIHDFNRVVKRT